MEIDVKRYIERATTYAQKHLKNKQDIEDLVQDSLLQLLKCDKSNWENLESSGVPEDFLIHSTLRWFMIGDMRRKNAKKRASPRNRDTFCDHMDYGMSVNPCSNASALEILEIVNDKMKDMHQREKDVMPYLIQNYQNADAARVLGITDDAYGKRVKKIRSYLAEILG